MAVSTEKVPRIHIIASALPPALDGIGDYTALLAAELARAGSQVTVFTGHTQRVPIDGVEIQTVFSYANRKSIRGILAPIEAAQPDWVMLQYNPFCYGCWGLNRHLPVAMAEIKQRSPKTRIALMAHETFVPIINWQFAVMTLWQRPQFWQLCQSADLMAFSMETWADLYRQKWPQKPVLHWPVHSNIPPVAITRCEARTRLAIPEGTLVLGLFGSAHISRMLSWVRSAAENLQAAGHTVLVLYIGPDSKSIRQELGTLPMIAEGPLPADEISRRISAMDIHLTPFVDGISTRRGTVMAGLQHGIATVGTVGYHTDRILKYVDGQAFLLVKVGEIDQFHARIRHLASDTESRRRMGTQGAALYRKEFAVEVSVAKMLAHMKVPSKKVPSKKVPDKEKMVRP